MTKDARGAFVRAAGIFVFYLTQSANEYCHDSGRQTIQPSDVRNAIRELNFEELEGPLEAFMVEYRREQANVAAEAKKKKGSSGRAVNDKAVNEDTIDGEHIDHLDEAAMEEEGLE